MGDKSPPPDPPDTFHTVYEAECAEIHERRAHYDEKAPSDGKAVEESTPPAQLVGLAFSGGGIRSGTICLGALQAFNDLKLLPIFDYLSTVSGGGFVGGWWSAWLSRTQVLAKLAKEKVPEALFPDDACPLISDHKVKYDATSSALLFGEQPETTKEIADSQSDHCPSALTDPIIGMTEGEKNYLLQLSTDPDYQEAVEKLYEQTSHLFPPQEEIEPQRSSNYVSTAALDEVKEGSINAGSDPIHHLRLYANYLTPRKGALSRDTWLAGAIVSRNLVLTWLILLPVIFAAVMVGRLFFLMAPGTVNLDAAGHRSLPYGQVFWDWQSTGDPLGEAGPSATDYWPEIKDRLPFAAAIPLGLLVLLAILTFLWLDTVQVDDRKGGRLLFSLAPILLAIFMLLCYVTWIFQQERHSNSALRIVWIAIFFLGTVFVGLGRLRRKHPEIFFRQVDQDDAHFRRNLIIQAHVQVLQLLVLISTIFVLAGFGHLLVGWVFETGSTWLAAGGWATLATVIGGFIFTTVKAAPAGGADVKYTPSLPAQVVFAVTPILVLGVIALTAAWLGHLLLEGLAPTYSVSAVVFAIINLLCAIIFYFFWQREKVQLAAWRRIVILGLILAFVLLLLSALLAVVDLPKNEACRRLWLAALVFEIVMTSIAWVIALGWTSDPNWLSLHGFYKVRLIRAYMGASNTSRAAARRDITESADNDDVPLCDLRNCQRGAPYHLINTTLNLVGGHDLTTAQRHAAYFTFSKLYCGSLRTGYRKTCKYMSAKMSLGTAVAISGAAASPNMGAKTPSAALAMLMTLNNVRLGYWAPTPSMKSWTKPQARLWPYYTLREFISQTNDLGEYCYLTDGGHFENTALYSLIERGCKYIIVFDCGADPNPPCFADMGDALRRCRMDFGTEIDLKIDPFGAGKKNPAKQHLIVGTIRYSPAHLKTLQRLNPDDKKEREGIIIWIKPMLTSDEPADVRQYGIENRNFPQQTTADQWFDEAQFESYRRLGQHSVMDAFEKLPTAQALKDAPKISADLIKNFFEEAKKAYP